MKRSQGQEGMWEGGWDNVLGDGLSLFSHCPRMIGFLFAFFNIFLHSFSPAFLWGYLLIGFRALLPVSICSFCLPAKGWKRKFPGFGVKFSTRVIFLWMGLSLVFISDLFLIGLDMWYSRDLTLFPESLFSTVSLSLFQMMAIWKRLRSNFLKGSSTWKPDG